MSVTTLIYPLQILNQKDITIQASLIKVLKTEAVLTVLSKHMTVYVIHYLQLLYWYDSLVYDRLSAIQVKSLLRRLKILKAWWHYCKSGNAVANLPVTNYCLSQTACTILINLWTAFRTLPLCSCDNNDNLKML